MGNRIKPALLWLVSLTGYPEPVRKLINRAPISTSIHAGTNVQISPRCEFSGDIRLGDGVRIGDHSVLNGEIEIGQGTNLNGKNELHGEIAIGDYCAIAPQATFRQHDHMTSKPSLQDRFYRDKFDTQLERVSKGPITVGNDVWLGSRSTVLSGVTIGDGAIVGAGAIVTEDVEPYSVVAGVPATRKKWRFRERIREELLEIEWWNWSEERIEDNRRFFETDLSTVDSAYAAIDS